MLALLLAGLALFLPAAAAWAVEPIKISRDDVALDLSGAVEIYRDQGDNFQVSTAPGLDGIVRRIEVEANDERSTGDWAVFALANSSDQQLDRLIVAPHFRLARSGLFWPDLGSNRIAAITPSEGFALDRQASPDSDVFLVTLDPGAVITFVAELASPRLPQVYLWDPEPYKDTINSYTLYRGIVIGIAGLLALFLTILFVVKGTSMFPATAAFAWAVLAYICIDFGFLNKVIEISPGSEQVWRAGTEIALAATLVVFLFTYLNLNRWHGHFSYGAIAWIFGLVMIAGVAIVDPSVAAGIARLSFAATAVIGIGLIVYLGIQGYDRAIMLVPSWLMVIVWLLGSWMAVTGTIDNDIVQPALGGGLILIILLIGFTVMQHAFAGGALHHGLFSDMERQALAITGSGDIVWDWDVLRDRVMTRPDVSVQLGLAPNALTGPARNWLPILHGDDRDTFRTTLDVVLEHRRGRVSQNFRLRGADGHYHWFSLRARPVSDRTAR
jgi:PAS domain-containing protein